MDEDRPIPKPRSRSMSPASPSYPPPALPSPPISPSSLIPPQPLVPSSPLSSPSTNSPTSPPPDLLASTKSPSPIPPPPTTAPPQRPHSFSDPRTPSPSQSDPLPTYGHQNSNGKPVRPPPPPVDQMKRPRMRDTAKSLSLPRRPPAADVAKARSIARKQTLDDIVLSSSPQARPRSAHSPENVQNKSTDTSNRPQTRAPADLVPTSDAVVNTAVENAEHMKSSSIAPSTVNDPSPEKGPTKPRRPFPPPNKSTFAAHVKKKRPPPVLVDAGDSQAKQVVKRAGEVVTVIDTRSPEQQLSTGDTNVEKESSGGEPLEENKPKNTPTKSTPVRPPPPSLSAKSPTHSSSSPPPLSTTRQLSSEASLPAAIPAPSSPSSPSPIDPFCSLPPKLSITATPEEDKATETATGSSPISGRAQKQIATDSLSPSTASESPKSKGRRFLNTMKQSLRFKGRGRKSESVRVTGEGSPKSHRRALTSRNRGSPCLSRNRNVYDKNIYPDELPQGVVDPLIIQCVAYLNRENILKEEGLFRIPGDLSNMKKLRAQFVRGEEVDLVSDVLDPHTIAGLLKLHFREMRVSLISRGQLLERAVLAVQSKQVEEFRDILKEVNQTSVLTLRMLSELLNHISQYSETNFMTSGTLATSCGPSIFPYLPPSNANAIVKFLIDYCSEIFVD